MSLCHLSRAGTSTYNITNCNGYEKVTIKLINKAAAKLDVNPTALNKIEGMKTFLEARN